MVGNDSSLHLKMFGEISKPLSAEMGDIFVIGPKYNLGLSYYPYSKISIFVFC